MAMLTTLTTEEWTYSAKSVDYIHIRDLHLCFYCLQREGELSQKRNTIRLWIQHECICVCVCPSVSQPSYTQTQRNTCTLVAKQTQVLGVLLRSQALYSHQVYSDCAGVTDRGMHEKRQLGEFRIIIVASLRKLSASNEAL